MTTTRLRIGRRTAAADHRARCSGRHRAFTAQLRGRRRAVPWLAPLPLVLLRPLRPLVRHGGLTIGLALNVIRHSTSLRSPAEWRAAADAVRSAGPPRGGFAPRHAGAPVPVHAVRVESHRTALLERVLVSQTRSVRHTVTRGTHGTRVERSTAYPRITIALARPQAAPFAAADAREASVAPRMQAVARAATGGVPALAAFTDAALPPRELARVTDHVLAQLDRRVLSFRERHGQI
jgi:hypothetical protein